ncbi:MAG: PP0621 family protein [Betaproteobacteria bacterium]
MAKVLIWIVVIGVVLFGLRLLNVAKAKRRDDPSDPRSPPASPGEPMVRCVRCGIYLPSSDAKRSPEGVICGEPGCGKRH